MDNKRQFIQKPVPERIKIENGEVVERKDHFKKGTRFEEHETQPE